MDAQFGEDGALRILFRTGYQNLRDVWLLQRPEGATAFSATRVSEDRWSLKSCPMDGPRFVAGPGRPTAVWMSDRFVYWSDQAGLDFQPRKRLSESEGKYPELARNADWKTLAVWEASGGLRWRTLPEGPFGTLPGTGHRAAVFVGNDGQFRIVN